MAYSHLPQFASFISETTLTTAYLYKLAYMTSDGYVLVPASGAGWTTGPKQAPIGVYYGGGGKTTSTQVEAVQIGIGGILKIKFSSDSTNVPGQFVCASSAGLATSPSTANFIIGRLIALTTGAARNIGSVLWNPVPFKGPKLGDISSTADT
jgi:hypothetical protein